MHVPENNTSVLVQDCAELLSCCGIGPFSHTFLRLEGHNKCLLCEKVVCQTCVIKSKSNKNNNTYCTLCYGSIFTGTTEIIAPITPLHVMIKTLHYMGHELNRSDDQEDVLSIFEYYSTNKQNERFGEDLFAKNI